MTIFSLDLTHLFATSRDYDELSAAWKGWRDATGPPMKNLYAEFVTLSNEAIKILGKHNFCFYSSK